MFWGSRKCLQADGEKVCTAADGQAVGSVAYTVGQWEAEESIDVELIAKSSSLYLPVTVEVYLFLFWMVKLG